LEFHTGSFQQDKQAWQSGSPGKPTMAARRRFATGKQGKKSHGEEADANHNRPCGIASPLSHGIAFGTRNRRHSASLEHSIRPNDEQ
jgi:hypothetical protein